MADNQPQEPGQTTQQQVPQGTLVEPQGGGQSNIDWKAEARKWEARAKENKEKADMLDQLEEANKSELEKANDRAAKAEQEAKDAQAALNHMNLVSKVSKAKGVPAELLHGATEEDLNECADGLLNYVASQTPSFPQDQGGSAGTPSPSLDAIRSIKNPIERVRALKESISLTN